MQSSEDSYVPPGATLGAVSYRRLAEHLKSLIIGGELTAGTKLPPVRRMAERLQVSNLTVHRAYAALAEAGFTYGNAGRGTFVAEKPTMSAGREVLARLIRTGPINSYELLSETSGLRSLATATPDPGLFDASELLAEFSDLRKASKWLWGYASPAGAPDLIMQFSRILRSRGIPATDDEIVVTNGETHGLSLLSQALGGPGRSMLIENPRGLLLKEALESHYVNAVSFKHTPEGIDLAEIDSLAGLYKPVALVITPTFANPTGAVLSLEQRIELLALAKKHNFLIIEIDSYRWLNYNGPMPPPMVSLDSDRVIYLDTFSYCLVPGLRLGYVRCGSALRSALMKLVQVTTISAPQILQVALSSYMSNGGFSRHLGRIVPRYKARRDALAASVSLYLPGVEWTPPSGGFSSWIRLPGNTDYSGLYVAAVDKGVGYAPGPMFSEEPDSSQYIRLAFSGLEPDAIREAVKVLGALVERA